MSFDFRDLIVLHYDELLMRTLAIEPLLIGRHGDLLAVNKPPDWPTTGRSLEDDDCVQFHLIKHFGEMVWAVHQLDADTSGLCLFALNKKLVGRMHAIWSLPEMVKEYLAIVHGEPNWDHFDMQSPIGSLGGGKLGVHVDGKRAHSIFHVLDRNNGFSLIRARIHTGRTHQIRIHLSHLGHPLVGEAWYRDTPCVLHPRQALHAHHLRFPTSHLLPSDGFTAPVSEDLFNLAAALSLRLAAD